MVEDIEDPSPKGSKEERVAPLANRKRDEVPLAEDDEDDLEDIGDVIFHE